MIVCLVWFLDDFCISVCFLIGIYYFPRLWEGYIFPVSHFRDFFLFKNFTCSRVSWMIFTTIRTLCFIWAFIFSIIGFLDTTFSTYSVPSTSFPVVPKFMALKASQGGGGWYVMVKFLDCVSNFDFFRYFRGINVRI